MASDALIEEIYLCQEKNSKPVGIRFGSFVFASNLAPVDPCTGAINSKNLDGQIDAIFESIDTFLRSSGLDHNNITRITFFMSDLTDRIKLNPPWEKWFPNPNDRPPHKYVPTTLPEGILVSAQVMALEAGQPRKVLEVPGVVHNDPMSMGALTGNLVTSSRVVTGEASDSEDEHTAKVFANVGALLNDAGGDYKNLTQVTAFIGGPEFRASVEKDLQKLTGSGNDAPILHFIEAILGGSRFARLEVLGLL